MNTKKKNQAKSDNKHMDGTFKPTRNKRNMTTLKITTQRAKLTKTKLRTYDSQR